MLAKKLYFDIYNLENDLKNKEQIVHEYQALFDEYILSYKKQNKDFANTYNEIDDLNKKFVQKEFDKTIKDIEVQLKNTTHAEPIIESEYRYKNKVQKDESKLLPSVVKNYREIVKITHPDMTLHLESIKQTEYTQLYHKATNYYNDNQLYGLLLLNKQLGNNPFNTSFTEADIDNLKNKKDTIESKVKDIQESFIWNFMQINDEKELNDFIAKHFKNMLNKMR